MNRKFLNNDFLKIITEIKERKRKERITDLALQCKIEEGNLSEKELGNLLNLVSRMLPKI